LSTSSYVSLASLENLECIVGGRNSFLGEHATKHKFLLGWSKRGMNKMVLFMLVWICKVGTSMLKLHVSLGMAPIYDLCRCSVAILEAGLHLVIIHSVGHALTFLEFMLDAYSDEFHDSDKWACAVTKWNVVQAILRNLSKRVDTCFLAVQTSAAVVFLSYVAGILDNIMTTSGDQQLHQGILVALGLPNLMIACSALMIFVKAAGVTETCTHVPPMMNAVKVDDVRTAINHDRQYVVSYITHSQAAFRVKGSRIDTTMLMNYCYICGAIACGLFTTGLSMSRQN